jgi:hypothetical protein
MIRFEPGEYTPTDWDRMAKRYHGASLMQAWAYGAAKSSQKTWRVERGVFRDQHDITGIAQLLIRPLPFVGGGLVWLNRGPLTDDGTQIAALAALRQFYGADKGYYLRVAPASAPDALDDKSLQLAGFAATSVAGWASAVLDLGAEPDALRAGLRQKWRNTLNKAERSGIEVESGDDAAALERFITEYEAFLEQKGFTSSVTGTLIRALAAAGGKALVVHRAIAGGVALGSVLIIHHGDTAEYLAASLADEGRRLGAGQFLLWHAVLAARVAGAAAFDLGGMDPDLTPKGIYDFKRGLNPAPYRLASEVESLGGGLRARAIRMMAARAREQAS